MPLPKLQILGLLLPQSLSVHQNGVTIVQPGEMTIVHQNEVEIAQQGGVTTVRQDEAAIVHQAEAKEALKMMNPNI